MPRLIFHLAKGKPAKKPPEQQALLDGNNPHQYPAEREPAVQFTEFIVYPTFFHVAVAPEGTANKFSLKYFNGFGQGYKKD